MPDIRHSLQGADLRHLKQIAEKWGIPLEAPDARHGIPELAEQLTDPELVDEMVDALPPRAREALRWLWKQNGRAPWDLFTRQFGDVREMGPGKRDRERPDLDPISPAEVLWYRAFLGRGFFDTEAGPKEFAYIPDDLKTCLPKDLFPPQELRAEGAQVLIARKATPEERREETPVSVQILDHTCTLLASLRMGIDPAVHLPGVEEPELQFYKRLLQSVKCLDEEGVPQPEQIRDFFDLPRDQGLLDLWKGWRNSSFHNDLHLTPGLRPEGTWDNKPLKVRLFLLRIISQLPENTWLSMSSFVARMKQDHSNFLRSAGEFDSWYIRDDETGEYLRGFEHWDDVEGTLLRYILTGPLHWLGVMDLASAKEEGQGPWTAFRISTYGQSLLADEAPDIPEPEPAPVHIRSKGWIRIPQTVPRKVRYQIARFCEWLPMKRDSYMYSLSPRSLRMAKEQELQMEHLLALLSKHAELVPPNLVKALQRWDQHGIQAAMEQETVLRVRSPAMLNAIQESRAVRYLREALGPTAVVIQEGSESKISEVLMEMGFLVDYFEGPSKGDLSEQEGEEGT
ncbi:MAG: hypothetical protein R6U57_06755 [Anaerolineales bacterium]